MLVRDALESYDTNGSDKTELILLFFSKQYVSSHMNAAIRQLQSRLSVASSQQASNCSIMKRAVRLYPSRRVPPICIRSLKPFRDGGINRTSPNSHNLLTTTSNIYSFFLVMLALASKLLEYYICNCCFKIHQK